MNRILRKRLGLIIASAIATLILITLALEPDDIPAPVRSALHPTGTAAIASPGQFPKSLPTVERDRLVADLTALDYPRFEAADRDRARIYLVDTLENLGWQTRLEPFAAGINLIAEQPNTPEDAETLLVGAHYDTVKDSPGADDNATAVATLLEIARIYAEQPPTRSLRLVFFDLEEAGLLGSLAHANQSANLDSLIGAVILDMVGYTCNQPGCQTYPEGLPITPPSDRGTFIGFIGDADHPELLAAFQSVDRPQEPAAVILPVPLSPDLPPDLARSDHVPFWQNGIGAVMVTDTADFRNPHYHQPTDTLDTLDLEFFTGVVQRVVDGVEILINQ
ncbi:MAG: M28 family peptidase [Cyanobacteria bacterium J06635_15]